MDTCAAAFDAAVIGGDHELAVEAAVASTALAKSLAIAPGDPVLVLRSTSYADERPVEMFVAYHRGDRSRFEVTLNRTRPADAHLEPLMRVTAPQ